MSDSVALVDSEIELSEEMLAAVAAVLLTYDEPELLSTRRITRPHARFRDPRGWR
ncbi:hypothetical protein ACFWUP_18385 [Nocardia sp. NPDC058658]|uniref:hypothetical protein n=1 Tax=Nocardia sp. NPDC058658 TaxID=3346580 RepID=UPI00364AD377